MVYKNDKIELTEEENTFLIKQIKKGVIYQLYKENLLTAAQLNQVLNNIEID